MVQQNVAVIGGGLKASVLAGKAFCLQKLGFPVSVTVFEQHEIGAAWNGWQGYTAERLCTPRKEIRRNQRS